MRKFCEFGIALELAVPAGCAARAFVSCGLLAVGRLVAPSLRAQETNIPIGGGNVTQVTVAPGNTLTITTSRRFSDLVVGNAAVADVVPLTERSLYIQGKASGATNISIYDEAKALLGVIDVRIRLDFSEMEAAIRAAVPSAKINISNVNDRIRLSGVVKNGTDLARVLEIAQQYSSEPVLNQLRVADAQQVCWRCASSRRRGAPAGIWVSASPASDAGGVGIFTASARLSIGVTRTVRSCESSAASPRQNGTRLSAN